MMKEEEEEDILERQQPVAAPPEKKEGKCSKCLWAAVGPLYLFIGLLHVYLICVNVKEVPPFLFTKGHWNSIPFAMMVTTCMCWPVSDIVMIEMAVITYFINDK
jgi:hypothetical protein